MGKTGQVHTFEPNPVNFEFVKQNVEVNVKGKLGRNNVVINNMGAADSNQVLEYTWYEYIYS